VRVFRIEVFGFRSVCGWGFRVRGLSLSLEVRVEVLIVLLQCVARCNTLKYTETHCNTLQHTAIHCNTPQHIATHRNTLQQRNGLGTQVKSHNAR